MFSIKSQEVESPLYLFEGADMPSDYRAAVDLSEEDELTKQSAEKPGFWNSRFQKAANTKPNKWDWIFGVIMPVVCFVADPIVFKIGFGPDDAFLSDYRPFAYLLSFSSIMAMIAWLLWGERLKGFGVLVSGVLAAGAAVSLLIGFLLLPLSLIGLIIVIGLLGFTPFFTFTVFWRNSVRAFAAAKPYFESGLLTRTVGLIALSAIVVPMVVNSALGNNIVARLLDIITR